MKNDERQTRIAEAEKFFNLIFGNLRGRKFGYLWTKQDKATYSFAVSSPDERAQMAAKAIELADNGADVYYGLNVMDVPPDRHARAKDEDVTAVTACPVDIDILGGTHADAAKYPADFDAAKSFLPFTPSILINSGYGLHALYLYDTPLELAADDARAIARRRNDTLISAIRSRAEQYSKAIDGVGDLPRVLRVPGTFNYKLGKDNAPLCHVVEVNDARFNPADLDAQLAALTPARAKPKQQGDAKLIFQSELSHDFDIWRATKMLDVIPVADLSRDEWLNIGMALKNTGNTVSDWEQWSRPDERYHAGECEKLWQGFNGTGLTIATICEIAERYGYDAQAAYREWHAIENNGKPRVTHKPALMNDDDGEVKFAMTQDKIKSCPVNLRLPDNYVFNRNGITLVVPPKKDGDNPKHICAARNPIVPTRKFREPIKGTLEYEFAILDSGKWRKVEIDGSALADTRDLSKSLARYGAQIKKGEHLREFFIDVLSLNPELQELKSYNQTGWIDDDCEEFAYPSANGNTIIRRAGYDYDKTFKPRGSREEWKKKFLEVTEQGGAISHVIIGAACASVLVKPLSLPNLQIHLWGKKSIGKTPMLKFAVSIYGNTDANFLTHTFSATPKSRLETACAFSDLPLICEELESAAKNTEKFSADIYNYFLGIGGQALKKDGTKRDPKLFSGVRLTDGEHSLVQSCGNGGEFKRVLELRASSLLDDALSSSLYEFVKLNRGLFGEDWIKYTIEHRGLISTNYHQTLDTVQAVRGKIYDLTQLRTLIVSLVNYQHFKTFLGLQENGSDLELANDIDAILRLMPTADEIDDTARAIEFLQSFSAGNDKFFAHETDKPEFENEFTQQTPTCYGKKFKNGEVAFLPHSFKKILEDEGGFKSADKLREEFYDKGYLRHMNGKTTYQTWFNGSNTKMIRFEAGIIEHATDADPATSFDDAAK